MKKSLLFLLALLLSSCVAEDHDEQCSVYLAESSLKNGGWGVFAGKDYEPGDRVGYAGLGVPFVEPDWIQEEFLSKFLA